MTAPVPADGLLVVDVGNSRIGLAVSDDDGMQPAARLTEPAPESWRGPIRESWDALRGARQRAVVISSVDPKRGRLFADLAQEICEVEPLFVRGDIPLPMELAVDNPRDVGSDRVCAAAAAFDRLEVTCAVASFGTATTIDCVSTDGVFFGGAILPGFRMACDALHEKTARLPRVEPARPESSFGKNTHDAIVNGVAYGLVGALREIVERFASELHQWPQLVITGGDAPLIADLADFVDSHVPDLVLRGVALAYQKAAQRG